MKLGMKFYYLMSICLIGGVANAADKSYTTRAQLEKEIRQSVSQRLPQSSPEKAPALKGDAQQAKDAVIVENEKNKAEKAIFSEEIVNNIEHTYAPVLRKAFETKSAAPLKALALQPTKFQFTRMGEINRKNLKTTDGLTYTNSEKVNLPPGEQAFAGFETEFKNFMSIYSKVDFAEVKVLQLHSEGFTPAVTDLRKADHLDLTCEFDVRGMNNNGMRQQDRGTFALKVQKIGNKWSFAGMNLSSHQYMTSTRKPAYSPMAKNAGFDSGKTYLRLEALRRGGYALALEDYDNDGHIDAFVGNYGESTLWKGQPDGSFTKVSAPKIEKITLAKAAAFADFDNDGKKDLIFTRFASDKLTGDVLMFKNTGNGNFEEMKNAFQSGILRLYAMPMAIADYNNDGYLDVYVGFPGSKDFSMTGTNTAGYNVNGLFLNDKKGAFADNSTLIPGHQNLTPHGAVASDFDLDGRMDILVMDDQRNLSPIYRNLGNGKFGQVNQELAISNRAYGMGIAVDDITGDGLPDVVMSSVTFNAQRRLATIAEDKSGLGPTSYGLRFFVNAGKNRFRESTVESGLADVGDGAGGVTLVDYDNNGLMDLYVVNGLWSGSSRDQNIDSLFAKAQQEGIAKQYNFQTGRGDSSRNDTRSDYMKILQNEKVREGGKSRTLSFGGHQRNRLFKNLGEGKFIEVGYLEGVDSMADGYMAVTADLKRDGRQSLILRNCDPGAADNKFPVVEVLANNHPNTNSIRISLKGVQSNPMGIGARVSAMVKGKAVVREMQANNSATQSEVVVHLGLGDAATADKVVVRWPSGKENTFKNVKPGKYVVEEGVTRQLATID